MVSKAVLKLWVKGFLDKQFENSIGNLNRVQSVASIFRIISCIDTALNLSFLEASLKTL